MSEIAKPGANKRLGVRITAGILSASLVLSLAVNAAVAVRIQSLGAQEAATNYLVENTDYVNQVFLERLQNKLQTIPKPLSLEDYYRLAGTQIAQMEYEGALLSIGKCLDLFDDSQSEELYLDLLMKKGCLEVLLEKYSDAETTLDEVLLIDPGQQQVHLIMAQIHASSNDLASLEQSLRSYLKMSPDENEIRALLAQTLFAKEDFEAAGEEYKTIIDSGDENMDMAHMNYVYAMTKLQTEDFETALESFETALAMDQENADAHYYIGICLMSLERYAEAVESFTYGIEENSMLQLNYYSRGVCGLMIEDYDYQTALEDLKQTEVYNGDDKDSEISLQASVLLAELETADGENRPQSEIVIQTQTTDEAEHDD